jgi:YD repeat-containing protein
LGGRRRVLGIRSSSDSPGRDVDPERPQGETPAGSVTCDEAGNLETVEDWLENVTAYSYDDARRLIETSLPIGIVTGYSYDDASRLESIVNTDATPSVISSFEYTLDAVATRPSAGATRSRTTTKTGWSRLL